MSLVKWSWSVLFVSLWSSVSVLGGKNAAVQSLLTPLVFSKISFIQSFWGVSVERLFTYSLHKYANKLSTCKPYYHTNLVTQSGRRSFPSLGIFLFQ